MHVAVLRSLIRIGALDKSQGLAETWNLISAPKIHGMLGSR